MMRSQRGAALPETALSLTVMLAVLVGGLRLALVGYEQISTDGGAGYDARQTSYTVTDPGDTTSLNPGAATIAVYPHTATNTINPSSPLPAPTVSVSTQYGFDQTNNRHGGVSMIQPLQQMSTVTNNNVDSLSPWTGGSVLSVTGYGIDAAYLETGVHADVNGDDFNSGQSTTDAVDYFQHGENTPPYFGGFDYMTYCPVTNVASMTTGTGWTSCTGGIAYRALGLAEYLTTDNWTRTSPGITPENAGNASGVFWETLYHHDVFSQISSALPANLSTPANVANAQAILDWGDSVTPSAGAQAYWTGKGYTITCTPIVYTTACNDDINKVFSWDQYRAAGNPPVGYTPGSLPLAPGAGYPPE